MTAQYLEHSLACVERLEGDVPKELRGTLYRVGPGKYDVGGHNYRHWLDGDGMVRAFRIADGRISFRNRYIETPWFLAEERAGRPRYLSLATPMRGGVLRAALQGGPKNPANTNIVAVGDKLLALWEGGRPFRLDPDSLETLCEETFSGALGRLAGFSAHPHVDAHTGDIYNIGSLFVPRPGLAVWCIKRGGACEQTARISLPKTYLVHDFGLTERHVVIVAGPIYMQPAKLIDQILGRTSLLECFAWHESEPLRVFLVPRDGGGRMRTYELEPASVIHAANAFEDGDETVIDCVLYTRGNPLTVVEDAFQGRVPETPPGQLARLRLGREGRASREIIAAPGIDFPRIDDRVSAARHRCVYALEFDAHSFGSGRILKIDTTTGSVSAHDFGASCHASEPVFVPRPGGTAEDDGWLLAIVYDARDHHSFLAIVRADRLGESDTRAHLPFHLPLDFHGSFHSM